MLIVADTHSGVPVFRQIAEQVRFHIASGLLKPGDELPSTRSLSTELSVNPMTVSKAYSLLEREGLLERRPGLPLLVKGRRGQALERERLEQLRGVLGPAVTAARQLGIEARDAAATFRDLLDEANPNDEPVA